MSTHTRSLLRAALSLALAAAAVFYLTEFVLRAVDQLDGVGRSPRWAILFVALVISLVGHLFNSWLWWYSLRRMEVSAGFAEAYRSWAVSRLARYIPGKVFAYAVRVGLHSQQHRGGSVSVAVVEGITTLASLALVSMVGAVFYWQQLEWRPSAQLLQFLLLAGGAGVVTLLVLMPWLKKLVSRLASEVSLPDLSTWLQLTGAQILLLLCHAAAFFLVLSDLTGVEWFWYPYVVAAYYLAALIGQLAVMVPAGLGVREASLLALLAPVVGEGLALFYAVILIRLVLIASELLNAGLSVLVYRKITVAAQE